MKADRGGSRETTGGSARHALQHEGRGWPALRGGVLPHCCTGALACLGELVHGLFSALTFLDKPEPSERLHPLPRQALLRARSLGLASRRGMRDKRNKLFFHGVCVVGWTTLLR